MKQAILIIGLLLCALPASAAITYESAESCVSVNTTNCAPASTVVGDVAIVFAARSGATAAPTCTATYAFTCPAGTPFTGSGGSSTTAISWITGCFIFTATNQGSGTWTNAGNVVMKVYRGTAGAGTCTAAFSTIKGTSTSAATGTITDTGFTMNLFTGTSWILEFNASRTATNVTCSAHAATNCTTTGTTMMISGGDSGAAVTSFTTETVSVNTTTRQVGVVLELVAQPCFGDSFGNGATCVQSTTLDIGGTSATAAYTLAGVSSSDMVVIHNSACDTSTCTANAHTMSIADSATSTCTPSHNTPFLTNGGATQMYSTYIWVCTGLSAGSHTWTITYSANDFFTNGAASEWSGLTAPAAFDSCNCDAAAVNTSTNPTVTTSASTNNATDLIYGINAQASTITPTQGTGYSTVAYNVNGILVEAKTVAATGSQTAAFVSASQTWHTMIAPIIISTPAAGGFVPQVGAFAPGP